MEESREAAMNRIVRLLIFLGLAASWAGCGRASPRPPDGDSTPRRPPTADAADRSQFQKVRGPAVAGLFYERHPEDLARQIDELLAEAQPEPVGRLRGLVAPHAGYRFSGPTAAVAYQQLVGRPIDTVVVMAPSHYARFDGASIPDAEAYETPLGFVPLAADAARLAQQEPFVLEPKCDVRRPPWWRLSPKDLPPFGEDTPHSWEHSLEVQLPILQRVLGEFSLLPIVFGEVDPEEVAQALAGLIDDKTLVVASSDLSHYLPYDTAKALDTACIRAICSLSPEWIEQQEACGKGPILALVALARQKGWRAKLLDYRNSGDTAGDRSQVVGYAAIAFYEPEGAEAEAAGPDLTEPLDLSADQRRFLLELARKTVEAAVRRESPPKLDEDFLEPKLLQPRGCFVTLQRGGELRGCIGSVFPMEPLSRAVASRARAAALEDPRFPSVRAEELPEIQVEVSVLTMPKRPAARTPDELLATLRPGIDGVVLRVGRRQSTFLPQVWEEIPGREQFLGNLAQKAGLPADAWRGSDAVVLTYQVESFEEDDEPAP
jgi:MEMO1 family protein